MTTLDNAEIEAQVRTALADLEIADWEWISIDPQFGDTADFCAEYGYDLPHSANTIVVASKRGAATFAACIVRACDRLDVNRRVRRLMGVPRASFAAPEETREVTGMMIGGVTCLALPDDLPIYADQRLLEMDYIIVGAGSRSGKLKMPPQELSKVPNLEFIEGLSLPTE
jgi:prolyl-tRNA editing enzyme YbaK/EbsC (Cys-tRNA(Pro) deacylase)